MLLEATPREVIAFRRFLFVITFLLSSLISDCIFKKENDYKIVAGQQGSNLKKLMAQLKSCWPNFKA